MLPAASFARGHALLSLFPDPVAPPAEMHALVDAAAASDGDAWLALQQARDVRGRTPLHVAVTHGDLGLLRKLLSSTRHQPCAPHHVLALDDNKVRLP